MNGLGLLIAIGAFYLGRAYQTQLNKIDNTNKKGNK